MGIGIGPRSVRTTLFVGRDGEIARLVAAQRETTAGTPAVVAITGEPGIGKTRMLSEFLRELPDADNVVLYVSCTDADRMLPYRPWIGGLGVLERLASDRVAESARVCRETLVSLRQEAAGQTASSPRSDEHARDRATAAIIDLIVDVAAKATAVVVIDDLHWMDEASLSVVERIVREVRRDAVLLVVAYRGGEAYRRPVCSVLESVAKHENFRSIALAGLRSHEVDRIYRSSGGGSLAPEALAGVLRRTGGNPLLVSELAHYAAASGTDPSFPANTGLRTIVLSRSRSLAESSVNLLYWAAVLGPVFSLGELARVTGMENELALTYLEQATAVELIRETPEPGFFCFRHELIRDGFLAGLSNARVAMMHRRVADTLETSTGGTKHAEIARHLFAAGDPKDAERMAMHAEAAAEQALRLDAREEALELVDRVLALSEHSSNLTPCSFARLYLLKARALTQLRRPEACEALRRSVGFFLEAGDSASAVAATLTPVPNVRRLGSFVTTVFSFRLDPELRDRALEIAPPDSRERGWLLCDSGEPGSDEALLIAIRTGDTALEMWTRAHRAVRLIPEGKLEESAAEHVTALAIARREHATDAEFHCLYWMDHRATMQGDINLVTRYACELRDVVERERRTSLLTAARFVEAIARYLAGDWERAIALALEALDRCARNETGFATQISLSVLVLSALESGKTEDGMRWLRQLRDLAPIPEAADLFLLPEVIRLTGDRTPLEWGGAAAVEPMLRTQGPYEWGASSMNTYNALMAIDAADTDRCRRFYDCFLPLSGSFLPGCICGMSTDRLLALLAATVGNPSAATAHFGDAIGFLERAGYRPRLAHTCCDYAGHLLRAGSPDESQRAAELLDRAGTIGDELGMKPLGERVAVLRASNRGHTARYNLTDREVEVLGLAARGFTNGDIGDLLHISALTVATHMRNILRKTGLANRTELSAIAVREGIIN